MSLNLTHRQATHHDTEVCIYEDPDSGEHVEVSLYDANQDEEPRFYSFTPAEAVRLADAVLSSAQRVEDRLPHGNS